MRLITIKLLLGFCLFSFTSCGQGKSAEIAEVKTEPHRYGGWYCPDNLNGFPAVNLANWKEVPVINGRLATKEETQSEASLIFVDLEKYPDAKPLDMTMPKLARFYNRNTDRKELIIVIQAINISNDSIVGFRYLNGGNGSARLNEIELLYENEIAMMTKSKFVTQQIDITAAREVVWEVLTDRENTAALQHVFDQDLKLKDAWRLKTNVNFNYPKSGDLTASYAGELFGNYYIQNDYDHLLYNEKFMLLEDQETKQTTLQIVSGPFGDDYETQKEILNAWAQKVKVLSEKQ